MNQIKLICTVEIDYIWFAIHPKQPNQYLNTNSGIVADTSAGRSYVISPVNLEKKLIDNTAAG